MAQVLTCIERDKILQQIRARQQAATLLSTGTNEIVGMTEWYAKDVGFLLEQLQNGNVPAEGPNRGTVEESADSP